MTDTFVTAIFESSDWIKEPISKSTDTHFGSKDGHGNFNYRMKFQFELPGEPRLKVQIFDYNTIGSNEVKGEDQILLKPYLHPSSASLTRKLIKEGKCETERVRLYVTHPNFPGQTRVLFPPSAL